MWFTKGFLLYGIHVYIIYLRQKYVSGINECACDGHSFFRDILETANEGVLFICVPLSTGSVLSTVAELVFFLCRTTRKQPIVFGLYRTTHDPLQSGLCAKTQIISHSLFINIIIIIIMLLYMYMYMYIRSGSATIILS